MLLPRRLPEAASLHNAFADQHYPRTSCLLHTGHVVSLAVDFALLQLITLIDEIISE